MIRILIISDDEEKWVERIKNSVIVSGIKRTKSSTDIHSEMFEIRIMSRLIEGARGYCYSVCIVDKHVNDSARDGLMASIKMSFIDLEGM